MTNIALTGAVAPTSDIRKHFPALERQVNQIPVAYFDGPGGTQVPHAVVDAISRYLFHHNANTHWAYPTSIETDAAIAAARTALADFLNAAPNEVAFGADMTTLTLHLGRALGRTFGRGDEIVVTELDHHANIDPWRVLASERGVTVHMARMILEDHPSANLARRLAERGLFLSHGNFYARTVVDRLGQAHSGVVRAGCACYTTTEKIDRLVHAISEIAGKVES